MKTTPTIQRLGHAAEEISRATAADHFRLGRRAGKIHKLPSGYLLAGREMFITVPRAPRPRRRDEPVPIRLAVETTHKYEPGWSHLNDSHDLGEATITHTKPIREDGDGGFSQLVIVSLSAEAARYRPRNIMRALRDVFRTACRCEHDCCGHMQCHASNVRRLCENRYAVIRCGYPNV